MDRPQRPDDGSPARLIATMVGIVGILLLGSLTWSAVGALFSAFGDATASLSNTRPTPGSLAALIGTPTPVATVVPVAADIANTPAPVTNPTAALATPVPTPVAATPTPAPQPSPQPSATPRPAATAVSDGRAPWILLPQPAPGGKVAPGSTLIEARGRGDAPITSMRLELDGSALPATFEQRSDSTWRAFASTRVSAGQHNVRATVVDDKGRTGGFRWSFEAAP